MRSSTPPRRRTPPGSPRGGAAGSPPATPERPVAAGRVSSGARSAADFSPRHSSGDRAWERALHRRIEALELQLQAEIAANRDLRSRGAVAEPPAPARDRAARASIQQERATWRRERYQLERQLHSARAAAADLATHLHDRGRGTREDDAAAAPPRATPPKATPPKAAPPKATPPKGAFDARGAAALVGQALEALGGADAAPRPSPKKSPRATPEKADDARLLDEVRADAAADEARLLAQVAAAERENREGADRLERALDRLAAAERTAVATARDADALAAADGRVRAHARRCRASWRAVFPDAFPRADGADAADATGDADAAPPPSDDALRCATLAARVLRERRRAGEAKAVARRFAAWRYGGRAPPRDAGGARVAALRRALAARRRVRALAAARAFWRWRRLPRARRRPSVLDALLPAAAGSGAKEQALAAAAEFFGGGQRGRRSEAARSEDFFGAGGGGAFGPGGGGPSRTRFRPGPRSEAAARPSTRSGDASTPPPTTSSPSRTPTGPPRPRPSSRAPRPRARTSKATTFGPRSASSRTRWRRGTAASRRPPGTSIGRDVAGRRGPSPSARSWRRRRVPRRRTRRSPRPR